MNGNESLDIDRDQLYGRPDEDLAERGGEPFQFYPTLIVGIGTTGLRVLREVRNLLKERSPALSDLVVFFGVDADSAGSHFLESPDEFAYIGLSREDGARVAEGIRDGLRPEISKWFDPRLTLADLAGNGAGTVRMAGRVQLYDRFDRFTTKFAAARQRLTSTENIIKAIYQTTRREIQINPTPSVYIVSSICGGTGAGTYLDIVAYLSAQLGVNAFMKGYFVLPSAFDEFIQADGFDISRLEANAHSCLHELEHLQTPDVLAADPMRFEWPGRHVHVQRHPPLRSCYLVERHNGRDQLLKNLNDVCSMIARVIAAEVGSPLASHAKSRQVDQVTVALDHPDELTGKQRPFSGLSVAAIVKSPASLEDYLWFCRLLRMTNRLLSLDVTVTEIPGRSLNQFLLDVGIAERGEHDNMIQEALQQTDGSEGVSVRSPLVAGLYVDEHWARKSNNKTVRDAILRRQRDLTAYLSEERTKDELIRHLNDRQRALIDKVITASRATGSEILGSHGARAAEEFANEFKAYCDAVAAELTVEGRTLRDARQRKKDVLAEVGLLAGRIPVGEGGRATAASAHNAVVGGELGIHLRDRARVAMTEVAGDLDAQIGVLKSIQFAASSLKARVEKESFQHLRRLDSRTNAGLYTLDQEALTSADSHLVEGQDLAVSADQLVHHVLDIAHAAGKPVEALLRLPPKPEDRLDVAEGLGLLRKRWSADLRGLVQLEDVTQLLRRQEQEHPAHVKAKFDALLAVDSPFVRFVYSGIAPVVRTSVILHPYSDQIDELQAWITRSTSPLVSSAGVAWLGSPYPFALQAVLHVHGLRAYYLKEAATFEKSYYDWFALAPSRPIERSRYGWRETTPIPVLSEMARAWALALAFGFIAKQARQYVFGIKNNKPEFASDLKTIDLTAASSAVSVTPAGTAPPGAVLGSTRWEAREVFGMKDQGREKVLKAVDLLFSPDVAAALGNYVTGVIEVRRDELFATDDPSGNDVREYFQLVEERAAILAYLDSASR